MFIFGLSTLSLVSARSHLVFLSAEVTRDGQVDNYKSDAYDEISERLNGESLQATTTRQVQLPAEDWKRTLFQEIERSMARLNHVGIFFNFDSDVIVSHFDSYDT